MRVSDDTLEKRKKSWKKVTHRTQNDDRTLTETFVLLNETNHFQSSSTPLHRPCFSYAEQTKNDLERNLL